MVLLIRNRPISRVAPRHLPCSRLFTKRGGNEMLSKPFEIMIWSSSGVMKLYAFATGLRMYRSSRRLTSNIRSLNGSHGSYSSSGASGSRAWAIHVSCGTSATTGAAGASLSSAATPAAAISDSVISATDDAPVGSGASAEAASEGSSGGARGASVGGVTGADSTRRVPKTDPQPVRMTPSAATASQRDKIPVLRRVDREISGHNIAERPSLLTL